MNTNTDEIYTIYPSNPLIQDTDSDTIYDGYEIANNLNPLNATDFDKDYDNDTLNNSFEFILRTNPRSNDSDNDTIVANSFTSILFI